MGRSETIAVKAGRILGFLRIYAIIRLFAERGSMQSSSAMCSSPSHLPALITVCLVRQCAVFLRTEVFDLQAVIAAFAPHFYLGRVVRFLV